MLDANIRPYINTPLEAMARPLIARNVSANTITLIGFFLGLLVIPCIATQNYAGAIGFILLNRLFDGLDGAIARLTTLSNFGSILDIVCDFTFYASIPFAFCILQPENGVAAAFVIFSFVGAISSFLAYAIMAEKQDMKTSQRGIKSFYHLGGICEGTETFVFLLSLCLFPDQFIVLSFGYGILCWLTTIGRVYRSWVDF